MENLKKKFQIIITKDGNILIKNLIKQKMQILFNFCLIRLKNRIAINKWKKLYNLLKNKEQTNHIKDISKIIKIIKKYIYLKKQLKFQKIIKKELLKNI